MSEPARASWQISTSIDNFSSVGRMHAHQFRVMAQEEGLQRHAVILGEAPDPAIVTKVMGPRSDGCTKRTVASLLHANCDITR